MLFNSLEFFLFLPIIFFAYWFLFQRTLKRQNIFLLISSYVFYGWWDWRFLSLIFLSTIVDYFIGLAIYESTKNRKRKLLLWGSIIFNLGLLGFFKYHNFFIESWVDVLASIGYEQKSMWTLQVILPVGISFYTFQTMSYSLDIYYKRMKPTKDFISFASFVSFFPQLVAGPIERASNLLPQILKPRKFKYKQGIEGLKLILWGMFKKVVIADSLSGFVNGIFDSYQDMNGGTLLLGLIYFAFQIYCDFSGYSDIAIGTAKLFGIELMSNFKFPYFSRDIGEFWRRWHISLSSWFRDYLYIPLGGSKNGKWKSIRNIFIIFVVSGFWHGANWTFIAWGFIHSLLYLPLFLFGKNRENMSTVVAENRWFPSIKEIFQMGITFASTLFAWIFFRSESVKDSFQYLDIMISNFAMPSANRGGVLFLILLVVLEWPMRRDERNPINYKNTYFRRFIYGCMAYLIFAHFKLVDLSQFIYFQF